MTTCEHCSFVRKLPRGEGDDFGDADGLKPVRKGKRAWSMDGGESDIEREARASEGRAVIAGAGEKRRGCRV
eukprot:scaffold43227_cov29-Tisochrysis_lutea.AAC.2